MSIYNTEAISRLMKKSAAEKNQLSITTLCDSKCTYCGQTQDFTDFQSVRSGHKDIAAIRKIIIQLDPEIPISIGQSDILVTEGEPFLHPDFKKIIRHIREIHPAAPIEITTNGHFLTADNINFLNEMGDVYIKVIFNSSDTDTRRAVMGDHELQSENTVNGIILLGESEIAYSGIIMAVPKLTDDEHLLKTALFLDANRADKIEISLPLCSAFIERDLFPELRKVYCELRSKIKNISSQINTPINLASELIQDLLPIVTGVVKNAPAWDAGIRTGDTILAVNGNIPISREDAFNMLSIPGPVEVAVKCDESVETLKWSNPFQYCSGIIMENDFSPNRAEYIRQAVEKNKGKSLLMCSEIGFGILSAVLKKLKLKQDEAQAVLVSCESSDRLIGTDKMLSIDDYENAYRMFMADSVEKANEITQLILPQESFDSEGYDYNMLDFMDLESRTGLKVIVI